MEVVKQHNKTFVPPVLPIVVGQKVSFFNADPDLHNVFSNSRAASFDLGKYKNEGRAREFTQTGVVDL